MDVVIAKLLSNNSVTFPLTEIEVIQLCINAQASFVSQPMLLDIKSPLNICGECDTRIIKAKLYHRHHQQVTFMDSLMSCVGFLNLAARQMQALVICF